MYFYSLQRYSLNSKYLQFLFGPFLGLLYSNLGWKFFIFVNLVWLILGACGYPINSGTRLKRIEMTKPEIMFLKFLIFFKYSILKMLVSHFLHPLSGVGWIQKFFTSDLDFVMRKIAEKKFPTKYNYWFRFRIGNILL